MNKKTVDAIKALSDETRLTILRYVFRKKEISCQELSAKFALAQPTMSHHIGKLIDAGVLSIRKEGVAHYYSVNQVFLRRVGINIVQLLEKAIA